MRLSAHGKPILVSVENITPFGIWLLVGEKEYFLDNNRFPFFQDQTLRAIRKVKLLHGCHLHWPDMDVDLEVDNLENPDKYPLSDRLFGRKNNVQNNRKALAVS